jgi:hypothetical protein
VGNKETLWFTEDHSAHTDVEGESWYSKLSKVAVTLVVEMIHVRLGYQGLAADHDPEEACRQLLLRVQNPGWMDGKYNKFPIFSCDDMQDWMQNLEPDQSSPTTTFRSRFKAVDAGVVSDRREEYGPAIDRAQRDAEELEDQYIAGLHDEDVDITIYDGLGIENPSAMGMAPVEPQQHSDFIELFAGASQLGRVKLHLQDLVLQQRRLGRIIVSCTTRLERIQQESWELRNTLKAYQQYRERLFQVMESIEGNTEEVQRLRALNQSIQGDPDYNVFLKDYQHERPVFPSVHNHRSYSPHVGSGKSPSLGDGRYPSKGPANPQSPLDVLSFWFPSCSWTSGTPTEACHRAESPCFPIIQYR